MGRSPRPRLDDVSIVFEVPGHPEPCALVYDCARRLPGVRAGAVERTEIVGLVRIALTVPNEPELFPRLLWCLVEVNLWCRRRWPLGPLYGSGVLYGDDPPGLELWACAVSLRVRGSGDCEDLAADLIAERLNEGRDAAPVFIPQARPDGSTLWHIVVERSGGILEDPSRALGMQ